MQTVMTAMPTASYIECLKDSPTFHCNLSASFKRITDFQEAITDVSDSFSQSIRAGVAFSCHYQTFCSKVDSLQTLYKEETAFQQQIAQAVDVLLTFKEQFASLMESFHLIQKDFKGFRETYSQLDECRRQWMRLGDSLDLAVQKCAVVPRSKAQEGQEADKARAAVGAEYRRGSLRYLAAVEAWDAGRQGRLLRVCAAVAGVEGAFYRRCGDTLVLSEAWVQRVRAEEAPRAPVTDWGDADVPEGPREGAGVIEGYLFKSGRKPWQRWQRRWFRVQDNRLLISKRGDAGLAPLETDLRICTAREAPDCDRRFCFELIGPGRSHLLQADSEDRASQWVAVFRRGMHNGIGSLPPVGHPGPVPDLETPQEAPAGAKLGPALIEGILRVPGNDLCCDCGDRRPRWASCSLGVTLCTECSGAHRSLGVHVSKVRSITLDNWEPEMLAVMYLLGNAVVNEIYEGALVPEEGGAPRRPGPDTDMAARRAWAEAKWQRRRFVRADSGAALLAQDGLAGAPQSALLGLGLRRRSLPAMALALAAGANPSQNVPDQDGRPRPPLLLAAAAGFWPACEYLVLNGARVDDVDSRGQTALHAAAQAEQVLAVWLLLKRGARQDLPDLDGCTAYQLAFRTANANTVTLLRLHVLNENTKEANLGSAGDETVNEVFRDFTEQAFLQLADWFLPGGGGQGEDGLPRTDSCRSLTAPGPP